MDFFTKLYTARLYTAQPGTGFFYYVLPAGCTDFPDGIGLQDALSSPAFQGSFVYSAGDPNITADTADSFVAAITGALAQSQDSRGFIWLTDPAAITPATCAILSLSPAGDMGGPLAAQIVPSLLSLTLTGGMTVSLDGTTLSLTNANPAFQGSAQPNSTRSPNALLPCDGTLRGTLRFDSFIQRQSLYDAWNWGFQYAFPSADTDVSDMTALWLPLAVGNLPSSGDMIGFHIAIDPSDPTNAFLPARTTVAFSGEILNQPAVPVALASGFATTTGLPVWLYPVPGQVDENPDTAYLVFNPGCQPDRVGPTSFQAAPAGAYELAVPDAPPDSRTLGMIGGLLGTEYIDFQIRGDSAAGDRLWFEAGKAALAPRFPFPAASPVSAPTDPSAPLLESGFVTSWATVVTAGGDGVVPYVAQPKGSPLLGRDPVIFASYPSLFGAMDPAVALPATTSPFPLAPYALAKAGDGVVSFDASQISSFESQVLATTRRSVIGDAGGSTALKTAVAKPAFLKSASRSRGGRIAAADGTGQDVVTTPSGQLVTLAADGSWDRILLGSNLEAASNGTLAFLQPGTDLQQAFSTGDLFLVIANATRLGSTDPDATGARFLNGMTIGDWLLTANVGYNSYNDYSNVIIVKGCKGALYDPSSDASRSASLVSSQDKWTLATDFAAPSDLDPADSSLPPGPPDPAELPVLSTWLRSYFQTASEQTDTEYFGTFNAIARDPDWTGILILAMDCGLPSDLAGLAAGIADPGAFMAHHLGIEVSPVENDPAAASIALSSSSSMFGLIYYQDPDYTPPAAGQSVTPVPVAEGADYDFRVLTLQVLFENTAVKLFQSYAQVTLNSLFGMPVERMGADGGNDANAVILKGTYVNNDGTPIYSMGALYTTTYYFDNNVFNKVEIDSAQMSTVDDGTETGILESLFSFSGYLDFKLVRTAEGVPFDLFSFGSPDGQDILRQGLHYANLGLQLTSPAASPTATAFRFVTDQITFDMVTSTPRPGCLYTNFALTLNGLTSGSADAAPEASNWLTVIPDAVFSGVDGTEWYGLSYRLDMGTPGALAGKAKLTSQLLTAWSTDSSGTDSYQALVGIQLPGTGGGAKLISLQNVLKLSIGQIWLAYDPDQSSFLLMLTDIALRFLGLLKIPPSGSTLFYLFGNPESGGKPSGLGWYALYNNEPDNS